jgi:hypothetical protein
VIRLVRRNAIAKPQLVLTFRGTIVRLHLVLCDPDSKAKVHCQLGPGEAIMCGCSFKVGSSGSPGSSEVEDVDKAGP